MKKDAIKYKKIFNKLTKNKDLNKFLLDKLSSENKPELIEIYEDVLFAIKNYKDYVNYVYKDSDTKETSSTDKKFGKFTNGLSERVEINEKLIKDIDTYFEDVLKKEYSINDNHLKEMEKVIKEINEKRKQNSPENYELNAKYLLNGVIISLSLYYSYNIYWSTMEHQKNLYRI